MANHPNRGKKYYDAPSPIMFDGRFPVAQSRGDITDGDAVAMRIVGFAASFDDAKKLVAELNKHR